MQRAELGWDTFFENGFEPYAHMGYSAARVAQHHRNGYIIITDEGELRAEIAGALRHRAVNPADLPAVGDWVAATLRTHEGSATIHGVLPRRSLFSRKEAGNSTSEQIVAANVDTLFLITGLDGNFNLQRIERYLVLAWESGARPVVVLSKADLCDALEDRTREVQAVAFGTPVIAVSVVDGTGLDELQHYMQPGGTVALLGSSGTGKSTLTNALAGDYVQETGDVSRSVGKGRHTTTSRELIVLPNGALVIDTPGMRELGLWSNEESLAETFEDIEGLARRCRFTDCRHADEPGCAIRTALASGDLDARRFRNYQKMRRELAYLERRVDQAAALEEKRRWKRIGMENRRRPDKRG
ncbi:MAG TPA: ribosome small subunit-dependent GTPase A [Candidatus Kapabacteria bacterium]|nr:ribosome small subunit-dependent GTPase A [Candidatus Kapabacteria bacterium]